MFRRSADGSWAPRQRLGVANAERVSGMVQGFVTVADWTGDGAPDLLFRTAFSKGIVVAPGPFREGEPIRVSREIDFTPSSRGLPDFSLADFAVADWDRDGKPDLLVRQGLPDGKGGLYWYRNLGGDGMPELAEGKLLLGPESLGTNWATSRVPGFCVADWNGDGWPDLVLTRDAVLPAAAPDKQADWRGTVVVYLRE